MTAVRMIITRRSRKRIAPAMMATSRLAGKALTEAAAANNRQTHILQLLTHSPV